MDVDGRRGKIGTLRRSVVHQQVHSAQLRVHLSLQPRHLVVLGAVGLEDERLLRPRLKALGLHSACILSVDVRQSHPHPPSGAAQRRSPSNPGGRAYDQRDVAWGEGGGGDDGAHGCRKAAGGQPGSASQPLVDQQPCSAREGAKSQREPHRASCQIWKG